jgi:hypothetical protein
MDRSALNPHTIPDQEKPMTEEELGRLAAREANLDAEQAVARADYRRMYDTGQWSAPKYNEALVRLAARYEEAKALAGREANVMADAMSDAVSLQFDTTGILPANRDEMGAMFYCGCPVCVGIRERARGRDPGRPGLIGTWRGVSLVGGVSGVTRPTGWGVGALTRPPRLPDGLPGLAGDLDALVIGYLGRLRQISAGRATCDPTIYMTPLEADMLRREWDVLTQTVMTRPGDRAWVDGFATLPPGALGYMYGRGYAGPQS